MSLAHREGRRSVFGWPLLLLLYLAVFPSHERVETVTVTSQGPREIPSSQNLVALGTPPSIARYHLPCR